MQQRTFQLMFTVYRAGNLLPKHILHQQKFQSRSEAKQFYYDNKNDFELLAYSVPQFNFKTRVNAVVTA